MTKKETGKRRGSSKRSRVIRRREKEILYYLFLSASVDSVCRIAMSATVLSDTILEPQAASTKLIAHMEAEFVKCVCCGLTEECTPAYIERVRERYNGNWICGLCSEAINYEILRSASLITAEEAMENHMNLCKKFTALKPPPNPTVHLITAMRQILKRSLDSPSRALRSMPASPTKKNSLPPPLARSGSCLSSLSG